VQHFAEMLDTEEDFLQRKRLLQKKLIHKQLLYVFCHVEANGKKNAKI